MIKLLIATFTIFAFAINAQDCEYDEYNYLINKACVDFYDKDYEGAKELYKKAFKLVSFPLGPDLDKALQSAIKTNDKVFAQSLSVILAKGGVPLQYFNQISNFSWYDTFLKNYALYKNESDLKFSQKARENIFQLKYIDSTFNAKYHSWRSGQIELTITELTDGAQKVLDGFKNHVEKYGFPCDKNLGYFYKDGRIKVYPIQILLTHIYQRGELLYFDELNQISCEGFMSESNIGMIEANRGFGNSTGVKQEMEVRYKRYRPLKN